MQRRVSLRGSAIAPTIPLGTLTQPDTAILPNLSLSTNQLSGRLTLSQTWMNSTLHSGGDRTLMSHVQTTLYLGSQRLKNLNAKAG
ncbi:hypothetical protein J5X98_07705 [Leptothermofonsia sichuanensis E412]|uniref:hypothetical protein n=1 Tax=Leptothermofonsia sichuanensis TaxID=2917832 RepID=UPI001CA69F06|nr:hypothetical protein [Leptothermofonsia sichuanensis]QZZ22263.1 hypothetical protein J5X98_07705 [Leptothermofonsia sichuanensis E412]